MKIISLSSSSSGNCIYLENEYLKILIDFGISTKQVEEKLKKIGITLNQIDICIITHEHLDHSKGIKTCSKKYPNIKFLFTNGTYLGIKEKLNIENINHEIIKYFQKIKFQNLEILFLPNSHDANEPNCLVIYENNKDNIFKIVHCTDTGYIIDKNLDYMKDADVYLLESNYDYNLLKKSDRPFSLKQRIDSHYGHLNNNLASEYINNFIDQKPTTWAILHISQQANNKEAIYRSIIENIEKIDLLNVIITNPNDITKIIE